LEIIQQQQPQAAFQRGQSYSEIIIKKDDENIAL